MKLIDALQITGSPVDEGSPVLRVFLACGFTPLHVRTFLDAHLRQHIPGTRPEIRTGVFGDLVGNIERLNATQTDTLVVALEWSDLDRRLGIRNLGGWRPADVADIVQSAERNALRLRHAISNAAHELATHRCTECISSSSRHLPELEFS